MFEPYGFLFATALVWTLFASIQDLKTQEVANWLTFSFVLTTLAYRIFYSIFNNSYDLFILGIIGIVFFFLLSEGLYYARVFGGGDAKLLVGFGGVFPYGSWIDVAVYGLGFVVLLLVIGVLYSVIASIFIAVRKRKEFVRSFQSLSKKYFLYYVILTLIFLILLSLIFSKWLVSILLFSFAVLFIFYLFLRAVDEGCMISLVKPEKLRPGDWLVEDLKIGGKKITASVHGLNEKEIAFLKKHRKSVRIRGGIPFVPAFLITLIFTGPVFLAMSKVLLQAQEFFQQLLS